MIRFVWIVVLFGGARALADDSSFIQIADKSKRSTQPHTGADDEGKIDQEYPGGADVTESCIFSDDRTGDDRGDWSVLGHGLAEGPKSTGDNEIMLDFEEDWCAWHFHPKKPYVLEGYKDYRVLIDEYHERGCRSDENACRFFRDGQSPEGTTYASGCEPTGDPKAFPSGCRAGMIYFFRLYCGCCKKHAGDDGSATSDILTTSGANLRNCSEAGYNACRIADYNNFFANSTLFTSDLRGNELHSNRLWTDWTTTSTQPAEIDCTGTTDQHRCTYDIQRWGAFSDYAEYSKKGSVTGNTNYSPNDFCDQWNDRVDGEHWDDYCDAKYPEDNEETERCNCKKRTLHVRTENIGPGTSCPAPATATTTTATTTTTTTRTTTVTATTPTTTPVPAPTPEPTD